MRAENRTAVAIKSDSMMMSCLFLYSRVVVPTRMISVGIIKILLTTQITISVSVDDKLRVVVVLGIKDLITVLIG